MKLGNKKKSRPPDWHFFELPGRQETLFYLRMASEIFSAMYVFYYQTVANIATHGCCALIFVSSPKHLIPHRLSIKQLVFYLDDYFVQSLGNSAGASA